MKNYKPILEKFFKNQLSSSEFKELISSLKKIIEKVLSIHFDKTVENYFIKYLGPEYPTDLSYELLQRLIYYKDYILNLPFIQENYLISTSLNLIHYHLSNDLKNIKRETNFEDFSSYLNKDPEEENLKLEDTLPSITFDYLENLYFSHIIELLKQRLTPKEIETLCWYVFKYTHKKVECKVNKNVLYKRWERLKPKLKALFGSENFEVISAQKLFDLIRSELCSKLDYNK